MTFDDTRKSAKTQNPSRNARQLQDLAISPVNYNMHAPNQKFFGSREAVALTLGNISPLFSELTHPNSVKHQLDRDHDSILSPEHSQTSKAAPRKPARTPWPNEAARPSLIPASLEIQAPKHASKPRSRYGARRPAELRLLTYSDKSLINEIQGYIQSKGRNRSIHRSRQSHN
jgi:hypothetical protein